MRLLITNCFECMKETVSELEPAGGRKAENMMCAELL